MMKMIKANCARCLGEMVYCDDKIGLVCNECNTSDIHGIFKYTVDKIGLEFEGGHYENKGRYNNDHPRWMRADYKGDGSVVIDNHCSSGTEECDECDGSGLVYRTCDFCHGDGRTRCAECDDGSKLDGKTVITCIACDGNGRLPETCEYCDGNGETQYENDGDFYNIGEVSSPQLTKDEVNLFIDRFYPDVHNDTCGNHVHISLNSEYGYSRLLTPDFYRYFMNRIEKWGKAWKLSDDHPFWKRFNGENDYCKQMDDGDSYQGYRQVNDQYSDHRYHILNYAWTRYKTIECRLAPVFDQPRIHKSFVHKFIEIIEDYLNKDSIPDVEVIEIDDEFESKFQGRINNSMTRELEPCV